MCATVFYVLFFLYVKCYIYSSADTVYSSAVSPRANAMA